MTTSGGSIIDGDFYYINRTEQLLFIIETIGRSEMGFDLDPEGDSTADEADLDDLNNDLYTELDIDDFSFYVSERLSDIQAIWDLEAIIDAQEATA